MRAEKTAATFFKYVLWTAAAAGITAAINNLSSLNIPDIYVPVLGALLKSAATWVATQEPK